MRNKSTLIFVIILLILVFFTGYNYYKRPFYTEPTEQELAQQLQQQQENLQKSNITPTPSPDLKKQFVELMSAEDKINQMIMYPVNVDASADEMEEEQEWIAENKPGFILLFGKKINKDSAQKTIEGINVSFEGDYPKPIIAVDHEGGTVQRLSGDGFTVLPAWTEMCDMGAQDRDEGENENENENNTIKLQERTELLQKSAQEIAEVGVNVVFAPVVDISDNNPALKTRVCGDAEELESAADDYITSFSDAGVMSVLKHFPGIGSTTSDLHKSHDEVILSEEDTDIFKTLLDKYQNIGLMISHVTIKDIINVPCSLSSECIGKLPVQYPDALIYTDALEMDSAGYQRDSKDLKPLPKVVVEAVYAGNNALVFGDGVSLEDFEKIHKALYLEYNNSSEFREKVDASAEKIIGLKKLPEIEN